MKLEAQLDTVAAKHGFSPAAVRQFYDAIRAGNGTAAQFSHPEFGGMGQWMRSGMMMIGEIHGDSRATVLKTVSTESETAHR